MLPDILKYPGVLQCIERALDEDIGSGDITSHALIPARAMARAIIQARAPASISGSGVAVACFRKVSRKIRCRILKKDGSQVRSGETIISLQGPARAILTGERVALNFMQRLSGIATITAQYVKAAGRGKTQILDTRKTTPGLRALDKYAVLCGGGRNHRFGLYDRVLIKDNHRRFWKGSRGSLAAAVSRAREVAPNSVIEIEVETMAELKDALKGRPDWILLDNMQVGLIRRCVRECNGQSRLEVSGGVELNMLKTISSTGVDAISVGRLTHSAPAVDMSLEFL